MREGAIRSKGFGFVETLLLGVPDLIFVTYPTWKYGQLCVL